MNHFFDDVLEVVKLIPKGKVTTYGKIASFLGSVKSSRSVGWALNNLSCNNEVPAHRVVNRKGLLTGKFHFKDENYMQNKLIEEGVMVKNNKVLNFNDYLWDPIKDLTM